MKTKQGKFFIALMLIPVGILASTRATVDASGRSAPLIIQEQGSFAVG